VAVVAAAGITDVWFVDLDDVGGLLQYISASDSASLVTDVSFVDVDDEGDMCK